MKIHYITFGCKANQYDSEAFRHLLEASGAGTAEIPQDADLCVVNTCTVTNSADAAARKAIRQLRRAHPGVKIVVVGCSAALRGEEYLAMAEVDDVVGGHDPTKVLRSVSAFGRVRLTDDFEPIGQSLRARSLRGSRAWLKIQDGCDRRCSFCATRLARGNSRSRTPEVLLKEAQLLSENHAEIVLTGIHIGHYGIDLEPSDSLSSLVRDLIEATSRVRFRLGSVEATEIDDELLALLVEVPDRLVSHLHIPMQSGSDGVLRRMRRWHTREQYRSRVKEIAARLPYLGLGADVITGFPGETEEEFLETRALIEELPFTYLHVFPYSKRDGTHAADMDSQVPGDVSAERSRVLRDLAQRKAARYHAMRAGQGAAVVVEEGQWGVTEDYLRVRVRDDDLAGSLVFRPLRLQDETLFAC